MPSFRFAKAALVVLLAFFTSTVFFAQDGVFAQDIPIAAQSEEAIESTIELSDTRVQALKERYERRVSELDFLVRSGATQDREKDD